jgi:hypothetical protein
MGGPGAARGVGCPGPGYDRSMRYLPNVLFVLALPVGAIGYTIGLAVMTALVPDLAKGLLGLLLPLLLGGLCMLPLLVPFFDRKAKQDLAAYRDREALSKGGGEEPGKGRGRRQ